ncbi:uncharacterized protein LOC144905508 isoform X2 [Branchiostoma floridae x Branchiostoma belcheri]
MRCHPVVDLWIRTGSCVTYSKGSKPRPCKATGLKLCRLQGLLNCLPLRFSPVFEKKPPVNMTSTDAQEYANRSKLWEKSMKEPMVPIGLAGTLAAVMYGAVNYRKYRRAGMSTSVFLMQFRVIAQSMVVGCMTLGVGYTLVSDYVLKHRQPAKSSDGYESSTYPYPWWIGP